MKCPDCGEECTRDMVDVGVSEIPSGPYGCENCHWVDKAIDLLESTPPAPPLTGAQEHARILRNHVVAYFGNRNISNLSDYPLHEALLAGAVALDAAPSSAPQSPCRNEECQAVRVALDAAMNRAERLLKTLRAAAIDADTITCIENDTRRDLGLPVKEQE